MPPGVHTCVLSHDAADLFFYHELLPSLEKWKHNTAVRLVLRDSVFRLGPYLYPTSAEWSQGDYGLVNLFTVRMFLLKAWS